ncbi:ankyrin repeat-containing domain protein [Mycena olivaceomarginata]|nr:ankyrin repeat-containing domain protein [Mycena olivaceomarginata]
MSERTSRRFKNAVAGVFRTRPPPPSASGSVPPPTAIDTPGTPIQANNSQSPSTVDALSAAHGATSSIPPTSVSLSESVIGAISTSTKDSTVDNAVLVLDIVEKLSGFAQTIPFIAPAAGFLSQILKAYKEVQDADHERDVLLSHITGISQDLCGTVLRMEATNHVNMIGRLKSDIETYTRWGFLAEWSYCTEVENCIRLLEETSKFLGEYDGLGALRRGAARSQLRTGLSDLQQKLDSFGARFRNNRLVDLAIQQSKIKETLDKVHDMALEKKLEEWLQSPPDMRQKQHETQKLRKEGTGCWFLEGTAFIEWQDNAGPLWIQGASGTGKSVLSSSVIQKLIDDQQLFADLGKSSGVAFFYFDFKAKDGNAVETALRRIVLQLSAQSPHPFGVLDKQYNLSRGQALPSYRDLQRILEELLKELGRVYIVLDALDECPDIELAQLRTIFTEAFMEVACILLDSDITQPDIELFITSELRENRQLKIWARRTDEIVERVLLMSNGMFRLAACLLLELSRCKRQNELDKTLANLPNDLFGIYDRFLETIREEDLIYVTGILRWLIFSAQNLNLIEIADAVAFDFSDPACYTYDPSMREDNTNAIPEWLEGLTTVRDYDNRKTIVLAHASVQDYLLSGRFTAKFGYDFAQGPSHSFIARACISYLLHFADHPLDTETFHNYPLAEYVARRWCHHLLRCHDPSALFAQAIHLLEDDSNQYNVLNDLRQYYGSRMLCFRDDAFEFVDLYGTRSFSRNPSSVPTFQPGSFRRVPPLHLCSAEGYTEGVRWLLQQGVDVNIRDADGSAFHAASGHGHTEIVRLLLEKGIDFNAKDGKGRTALEVACAEDHTDVVRLLLESGADANEKGAFLGTALQAASWVGNKEVVGLLLAHGADINAQGKYFGSALQAASSHGNTEITRILLERGADSNRRGGNYGSALAAASMNGHADPVRLLLEHGADVNINAQNNLFGTRAQAMRLREYDEAARFLLAKGADVSAQNEYLGSALQAASMNGHSEIVRLLLQNGADVNARGWGGGNALHIASSSGDMQLVRLLLHGADVNARNDGLDAACKNGHAEVNVLGTASRNGDIEIIRLLLEKGPNANTNWEHFRSALYAATDSGHIEVIHLLLKNGGDLRADDESLRRLLDVACHEGHTQIIQFLLDNGADANGNDNSSYHGTPLQAAAYSGKMDIFRLLIQSGADVNADSLNSEFATALQAVSYWGHADIIRLLLENGADVNARGGAYETALQAAACFGRKSNREAIALLLANGADANAQGGKYGGALPRACKNGDIESVRLLLANGADVNAQGGKYVNALSAARQSGSEKIVQLLLENGADVNAGLPLYTLSHRDTQITRLLLENGAEDTRDRRHESASRFGYVDLVRSLLASGGNVNEEGGASGTALRAASQHGRPEIARLLLGNSAHVNAQGGPEGRALHDAIYAGHIETVRLLVENGADVNAQDRLRGSALHSASRRGQTEMVHLLLESGADVNARDTYNGTALHEASSNEHTEIMHLLLRNGADVNAQGGAYGNVLQAACTRDNTNVVRLLLENGADVNADVGKGTSLHTACRNGHTRLARLLIDHGADINVQGGVYGSTLQAAATSGDSDLEGDTEARWVPPRGCSMRLSFVSCANMGRK